MILRLDIGAVRWYLSGVTLKGTVLLVTFLESAATILVERGIYFYSGKFFRFGYVQNLLLALLFGSFYAASAFTTHRLAGRLGERRLLLAVMLLHLPMLLLMQAGSASILVLATAFSGVLYGLKWPIIESYMASWDTPAVALRSIGRFNLSWSIATPVALLFAGMLIDLHRAALFAGAAALTLCSLVLVSLLPARPSLLPVDHPERPSPGTLQRYRSLLLSARWLMFCSYSLMWILAAVLPITFSRLGMSVSLASPLSAVIDLMRAAVFVLCRFWTAWHGRKTPLLLVTAGLPAGFLLSLLGGNIPLILAGEAVFGLSAGMCYYAALYYALVEKNAAVEAGGAHEGVIGLGFAAGPLLGAAGYWAGTAWSNEVLGILAGAAPLILWCSARSGRALLAIGEKEDPPPKGRDPAP